MVSRTLTLLLAFGGILISNSQASTGPTIEPRIVSGESTRIEQVPSTVALINRALVASNTNFRSGQFCAGTAVTAQWVLTAAHCLFDEAGDPVPPETIMALMDSADLGFTSSVPVNITEIHVPPRFVDANSGDDIALLRLETDASAPAIAIDDIALRDGDLAFVVGWGALNGFDPDSQQSLPDDFQQSFPEDLQGGFLNIVPAQLCASRFQEYQGIVNASMLCADREVNRVDSCQGDSGGPLYRVSTETGDVLALTGIVSFGIGCGLDEAPGVYTHVGFHMQWIESITADFTRVSQQTTAPDFEPVLVGLLPANDDVELSALDELGTGSFGKVALLLLFSLVVLSRFKTTKTIS